MLTIFLAGLRFHSGCGVLQGKTCQVLSFLNGLHGSRMVGRVLIVLSVSLMQHWEDQLAKWCPGMRVRLFHGSGKKKRELELRETQRKGGVCLTTYGLVTTSVDLLNDFSHTAKAEEWDWVILDEGHTVRNHNTKVAKEMRRLKVARRLILTGTPIQNNLREMWSLFDFVSAGTLLGPLESFIEHYEAPILAGGDKDACSNEVRWGHAAQASLRKRVEPFFLRRTKDDLKMIDGGCAEGDEQGRDGVQSLPTKRGEIF